MRAGLSDEQCQRYEHDGYLSPLPVFDADEVRDLRARFEAFEELHESTLRTDLHLLEKWAWHAVTDARVVDPVVSLLGPDVLLWSLNWFIKEPGDGKIVSMHQDEQGSWDQWVASNINVSYTTHHISEPGIHTLKWWRVDAGIVLQKNDQLPWILSPA